MWAAWAAVAGAQQVAMPLAVPGGEPPPAAVVAPEGEEMRSGPSLGLSAGLATGVGPTLGIPFGRSLAFQVTLLPVVVPDEGAGGSFGLRAQQFLGRNPRARMYLVEGVAATGWGESWLWGAGVGAGVEVRKDASTGLTKWFDLTLTAFGADEPVLLLPLPQAGIAWVF